MERGVAGGKAETSRLPLTWIITPVDAKTTGEVKAAIERLAARDPLEAVTR